jgi:hypothetical protein
MKRSEIRAMFEPDRSAGFQTCCVADFQVGKAPDAVWSADLEIRDTTDLEVCVTGRSAS